MAASTGRPAPLPPLPKAWVYLTEDADPVYVTMRQQDMVAWEETAAKHKWPGMQAAPTTFMFFAAWHAMRRGGQLPASMATWEAFRDTVHGVAPEEEEAGADDAPDPTGPAPITASPPN